MFYMFLDFLKFFLIFQTLFYIFQLSVSVMYQTDKYIVIRLQKIRMNGHHIVNGVCGVFDEWENIKPV